MQRDSPVNVAALPKRAKQALAVRVRKLAEMAIAECRNADEVDKAMTNCNQWFIWGVFTSNDLAELQQKCNNKMNEFQKEINYESND